MFLRDESVIDESQRQRMTKYNTHISRVYGMAKIHKQPVTLRHVVSTVDSPSSHLAIWLDNLLKPYGKGRYDVLNSIEAAEKIRSVTIDSNKTLISFDIVALFPSVPLDLARLIITDDLWPRIHEQTGISKPLLTDIFDFVTNESAIFIWNDKFIKQKEGVFMGINTSPTIAALVVNKLLETVISELDFEPKLLIKYVDDLGAVVPKDQVHHILSRLNEFMPSHLKFTYEEERNGSLPYLDMLLKRDENGAIGIDWYQKPTSADKVLHFFSEHPMFHRILSFVDKEFHGIILIRRLIFCLQTNIRRNWSNGKCTRLLPNTTQLRKELPEKTIIKSLPFVNGLTQSVKRVINKFDTGIQLVSRPINQQNGTTFTKLKKPFKTLDKMNVVYKIPCAGKFDINGQLMEKCDKCYVGQTMNMLSCRNNTHRNSCKGDDYSGYTRTALVVHCEPNENGDRHVMNFDDISVLETEKRLYKRLILENLHIRNESTVNTRSDGGAPISASYCTLLRS